MGDSQKLYFKRCLSSLFGIYKTCENSEEDINLINAVRKVSDSENIK